jgi:L-galactose dehydrogenase
MQYRELGKTGLNLSILGFGASPLGSVFHPIDENAGIRSVHTAIDLGINYIDVSPYYGITKAETVLGKALREIPRDRYTLSTKVGRYGSNDFDFSAKRVTASIDESLARLNVEMIDLILCHDIENVSLDQVIDETIPALRRVQETGKVRFIGISGLPLKIFSYVTDRTELDFILSYCHYTLTDTALQGLIPSLKEKNLGIINASPLCMGLLTEHGIPDWHPAAPDVKAAVQEATRLCRSRGVDIAQLALQFSTSNPDVATTLVGIDSPEQITTNVRWIDEPIDQELLREVQAILAPVQNKLWISGRPENNDIPLAN